MPGFFGFPWGKSSATDLTMRSTETRLLLPDDDGVADLGASRQVRQEGAPRVVGVDIELEVGERLFLLQGWNHTIRHCTYTSFPGGVTHKVLLKRPNWFVKPADLKHEADMMLKANQQGGHENIVSMLFSGVVRYPGCALSMDYFTLVMQHGGKNLIHYITHRHPFELSDFRQIAAGVAFLHNKAQVLHVKLTPSNIVRGNDGNIRICGFRHSLDMRQERASQVSGWTPKVDAYLAPEIASAVLCGTVSSALADLYTAQSVIYSLAIIFTEMLFQRFVSFGSPDSDFHHYNDDEHRPSLVDACSPSFNALVSSMWCLDRDVRPAAAEVVERLNELPKIRA